MEAAHTVDFLEDSKSTFLISILSAFPPYAHGHSLTEAAGSKINVAC